MGGEGPAVIRALLIANAGVTALVPATKIQTDVLPQGVGLPAILIEDVGSIPRNPLKSRGKKHFRDRVQVTANAKNYDALQLIMKAVFSACADTFPTIAGLTKVAVIADAEGPDGFNPDNNARAKPQDFIVRYTLDV